MCTLCTCLTFWMSVPRHEYTCSSDFRLEVFGRVFKFSALYVSLHSSLSTLTGGGREGERERERELKYDKHNYYQHWSVLLSNILLHRWRVRDGPVPTHTPPLSRLIRNSSEPTPKQTAEGNLNKVTVTTVTTETTLPSAPRSFMIFFGLLTSLTPSYVSLTASRRYSSFLMAQWVCLSFSNMLFISERDLSLGTNKWALERKK